MAAILEELPDQSRPIFATLLDLVRKTMQGGFDEVMNWCTIIFNVPPTTSSKTYNGKPLMYAAIDMQKIPVGFYLCGLYCSAPLLERFKSTHKLANIKLNRGKACIRTKREEQILEPAIGAAIAAFNATKHAEYTRPVRESC